MFYYNKVGVSSEPPSVTGEGRHTIRRDTPSPGPRLDGLKTVTLFRSPKSRDSRPYCTI